MKTKKGKFCGIIAVILMAALVFTACKKDPEEEDVPENWPPEKRWTAWQDPGSSAKLDSFSVDKDGVATIKTSSVADSEAWRITAEYAYTSKADARYKYTIEAWTASGTTGTDIIVLFYEDNDNKIYKFQSIELTTTRQTFTIYGERLPGKHDKIHFQCANLIGTFYLKVVSIEEFDTGELTITNFRGASGLLDLWTGGEAEIGNDKYLWFEGFSVPSTGNSIIVEVYNKDEYGNRADPFTGNVTVKLGKLCIDQWGEDFYWVRYSSKSPITFTNGNAAVNFGQQMQLEFVRELIGTLKITDINISDILDILGSAELQNGEYNYLWFFDFEVVSGDLILKVCHFREDLNDPVFSNGTVQQNDLQISIWIDGEDPIRYTNNTAISFTDGSATINFNTQME